MFIMSLSARKSDLQDATDVTTAAAEVDADDEDKKLILELAARKEQEAILCFIVSVHIHC